MVQSPLQDTSVIRHSYAGVLREGSFEKTRACSLEDLSPSELQQLYFDVRQGDLERQAQVKQKRIQLRSRMAQNAVAKAAEMQRRLSEQEAEENHREERSQQRKADFEDWLLSAKQKAQSRKAQHEALLQNILLDRHKRLKEGQRLEQERQRERDRRLERHHSQQGLLLGIDLSSEASRRPRNLSANGLRTQSRQRPQSAPLAGGSPKKSMQRPQSAPLIRQCHAGKGANEAKSKSVAFDPGREAALRAELMPLKVAALRRRSMEAGASQEEAETAHDADNPRRALVDLIVHKQMEKARELAEKDPAITPLRQLAKQTQLVNFAGLLESACNIYAAPLVHSRAHSCSHRPIRRRSKRTCSRSTFVSIKMLSLS